MKRAAVRIAGLGRAPSLCAASVLVASSLLIGCQQNSATTQPTTKPANMRARQDQAMKDPFGYSANPESTDISGGGLTDFDRQGFNRDLKNALDP
jgi:hypothetical protein